MCVVRISDSDPCIFISCQYYQVCSVSGGTVCCLDTCINNGPCLDDKLCRLVDYPAGSPCSKRAVCESKLYVKHLYMLGH